MYTAMSVKDDTRREKRQTGDQSNWASKNEAEDEYYRAAARDEYDYVSGSVYPGKLPSHTFAFVQALADICHHPTDIERPHTPVSPYFTLSRLSTTTPSSTKVDQYHNDEASWEEQSSTTASRRYPHSLPHSPICCPESAFLAQTEIPSSPPQTPRHLNHQVQDHDHNLPTPPPTPENTRKNSRVPSAALRMRIPCSASENELRVTPQVHVPKSFLEQYAEVRALFMGSSRRRREEQEVMRKRDSAMGRGVDAKT